MKVRPGDVIKFHKSISFFVIGLEEKEDEEQNEQKDIEDLKKKVRTPKEFYDEHVSRKLLIGGGLRTHSKPRNIQSVTWGMVDDEEVYESANRQVQRLDLEILRRIPGLQIGQYSKIEEYGRKIEKLEEIERNYERLAHEHEDIKRKSSSRFEDEEENEGSGSLRVREYQMSARLDGMESKMSDLENEIQLLEDIIRREIFKEEIGDKKRLGIRRNRREIDEEDEENDFYDETKRNALSNENGKRVQGNIGTPSSSRKEESNGTVETLDDIMGQLEKALVKKKEIVQEMNLLLKKIEEDQNSQLEEDADELEVFYKGQNKEMLVNDSRGMAKRLKEAEEECRKCEGVVRQLKPGFRIDEFEKSLSESKGEKSKREKEKTPLEKIKEKFEKRENAPKGNGKAIEKEEEDDDDSLGENEELGASSRRPKEKMEEELEEEFEESTNDLLAKEYSSRDIPDLSLNPKFRKTLY